MKKTYLPAHMHHYLLWLLTFLSGYSLYGQQEFAPIGAQWAVNKATSAETSPPLAGVQIIESEGDSLIDGMSYRKVGDYLFLQDGEQIYYRWEDSLRLIYDFDVAVGDTVTFEMLTCEQTEVVANTFLVSEVTTENMDGVNLKKISCEILSGYVSYSALPYTYVERMGSLRLLVEDLANCDLIVGVLPEWLRCYHDADIEYISDYWLSFGDLDCDFAGGPNSVDEASLPDFNVYPNPSQDYLQLDGLENRRVQISLHAPNGTTHLKMQQSGNSTLDIRHLPAGIYFLTVEEEGKLLVVRKVVKW